MPFFTRIYFDSNILIAASWPNASAGLANLLSLAQLLKVNVFLPKAVEDELEAHWSRLFDEKYSKANKSLADLTKHAAEQEVKSLANLDIANKDAALAAYREKVATLKNEWKIETSPLTPRPTDELFCMAIHDQPPFQKGDIGFQDAVIFFSVIDHLTKQPDHVAAFVSRDAIFADHGVLKHAKSAGVTVEIFATIDEVSKVLDGRLESAIKHAWDQDRKRATEVLIGRLSDVQTFVSDNLELSEHELGFGNRILAVRGIEVQGIQNVQTPFVLDRKENEPVRISFALELTLKLQVERLSIPQATSYLKVGQEAPRFEMKHLGEILSGPIQNEETIPWSAEVEAEAPAGDKSYENLRLISVRSKGRSISRLLEALERDQMQFEPQKDSQ